MFAVGLVDVVEVERFDVEEPSQHLVLIVEHQAQASHEALGVGQLGHADAPTADLVGEGGADALAGRADGSLAAELLLLLIDDRMPGHDQMGAVGDFEAFGADAARLEHGDLVDQRLRIDDQSVADDGGFVGVEDACRDEMEGELAFFVDDGVSGVVAGGIADHDRRVASEQVDDATLALIAPLATDRHDCRHFAHSDPGAARLSQAPWLLDGERKGHREPQASVARWNAIASAGNGCGWR